MATQNASAAATRDVVTTTTGDSFRTAIDASGFSLIADEPSAGSDAGAGPNPYDYLLAALGACTGMTMRMYAARKQWPLDSVVVRLRHGRKHAADCEQCETPGSNLARVEREIEITGALDEAQRARLLQIANMCPVHRSLEAGFQVVTTAVPPAKGPASPAADSISS